VASVIAVVSAQRTRFFDSLLVCVITLLMSVSLLWLRCLGGLVAANFYSHLHSACDVDWKT
jgi:hypothetical protein